LGWKNFSTEVGVAAGAGRQVAGMQSLSIKVPVHGPGGNLRLDLLVQGALEIVLGSAATLYCWLALRRGRSIRAIATTVLRTYRRPITEANIRAQTPFLKIAMLGGLLIGAVLILSGLVTVVRGL
jgi:hypothetical protein